MVAWADELLPENIHLHLNEDPLEEAIKAQQQTQCHEYILRLQDRHTLCSNSVESPRSGAPRVRPVGLERIKVHELNQRSLRLRLVGNYEEQDDAKHDFADAHEQPHLQGLREV